MNAAQTILNDAQIVAELSTLPSSDLRTLIARERWRNQLARPCQLAPQTLEWLTWLFLAGRGTGKTRSGAEDTWEYCVDHPNVIVGLIGPTQGDTKHTMFLGESGLIACAPEGVIQNWNKSEMILTFTNGSVARGFSAEKPDRLRGPQFHRVWCDEVCAWMYPDETMSNIDFALRLDDGTGNGARKIVTTTPRPTKLIRDMVKDPLCLISKSSTYDNAHNLSPAAVARMRKKYEGTRLGEQELHGKILSDNPFALWQMNMIRHTESDEDGKILLPKLARVVVAVDPPASTGEDADACGIVAAAKNTEVNEKAWAQYTVMEDATTQGQSPQGWAKSVHECAMRVGADCIVAEVNNGGDMVIATLKAYQQTRPENERFRLKKVHASRGKVTRAEPIASMYEQGRVTHHRHMGKLEDQMCDFTTDFDKKKKGYSPDRVDALVWVLTELSGGKQLNPRVRAL